MSKNRFHRTRGFYIEFDFDAPMEYAEFKELYQRTYGKVRNPEYNSVERNKHHKSYPNRELLMRGMLAVDQDTSLEQNDNSVVSKMLHQSYLREFHEDKYLELFAREGYDTFVIACDVDNIDGNRLLERRGYKIDISLPSSVCSGKWLNMMLVSGEPQPSSKIRKMAISASVIGDTNRDWDRMEAIAHRAGLISGSYGYWQK